MVKSRYRVQKRAEGYVKFDDEAAVDKFYIRAGSLYTNSLGTVKEFGTDETYIMTDKHFGVNYRFTGEKKAVNKIQRALGWEARKLHGTYLKRSVTESKERATAPELGGPVIAGRKPPPR